MEKEGEEGEKEGEEEGGRMREREGILSYYFSVYKNPPLL